MSADEANHASEQQPPSLRELARNLFWDFLRRKIGPRWATIIYLAVGVAVAAAFARRDIAEGFSFLHEQIVEWRPLPKAKPDVFTVALARLEDDQDGHLGLDISRDLLELSKSNGIAVLQFPRTISDEDPQAGNAKARKWLGESGAQVLIWGRVLIASGKPAVPLLYWTNSENSGPKKLSERYVLSDDYRLPPVFQNDLADILHLLVVTENSDLNRMGVTE